MTHAGEAEGPARDQSRVQHAAAEARHVPDQSRFRLRDVATSTAGSTSPGQHGGAGEALRRDGVRGAGSGGALAGLGRQDQSAGPGLRGLHLGRGHCRVGAQGRRGLDLAHHHQPPDHRRQAIRRDRPHLRRPLHPQHRHRLGAAGDRDVRPADAVATRSATPAPRNGSPSSSGCGRRTSRSTTRAASSRSRRAIWRRSRSSTPTPRS